MLERMFRRYYLQKSRLAFQREICFYIAVDAHLGDREMQLNRTRRATETVALSRRKTST